MSSLEGSITLLCPIKAPQVDGLNRVIVTVSGIYESQGEHFITLPDTNKGSTLILVDLPQGVYAGKSVTLKLD